MKSRLSASVACVFLMCATATQAQIIAGTPSMVQGDARDSASLSERAAVNPVLAKYLGSLKQDAAAQGKVEVVVKLAVRETNRASQAAIHSQYRAIGTALTALKTAVPDAQAFSPNRFRSHVHLTVSSKALDALLSAAGVEGIVRAEDFNPLQGNFIGLRESAAGEISALIRGGEDAKPGTHPFHVALFHPDESKKYPYCGGALVSDRYVATAAHCLIEVLPGDLSLLVGARRLDEPGARRVKVKNIIHHPGWDDVNYDVAVLELAEPIKGVPFASLARSLPKKGELLMHTGWGHYKPDPKVKDGYLQPERMQQALLPFVPADPKLTDLGDDYIWAGGGGKGSCFRDSGGPLTKKNAAGQYVELIGLVSGGVMGAPEGFAYECKDVPYPISYANVSQPAIRDFIESPPALIGLETPLNVQAKTGETVVVTLSRSSTANSASVEFLANAGPFFGDSALVGSDFTSSPKTTIIESEFGGKSAVGKVNFKRGQKSAQVSFTIKPKPSSVERVFSVTLRNPSPGFAINHRMRTTITIPPSQK